MGREQLAAFLAVVHPGHATFLRLIAATGLRWSEPVALRWRDLELETAPAVKVRRRLRRGNFGPPKSRHGRRDVRITPTLAADLRGLHARTEWPRADDLVFVSLRGTPLDHSDMTRRVLKAPALDLVTALARRPSVAPTAPDATAQGGNKVATRGR